MSEVLVAATVSAADPVTAAPTPQVVRLSMNLAPSVATALQDLCRKKGISVTEGVRRAIALWKFLEEEREQGHRLAIVERGRAGDRIRELVLKD